MRFALLAALAAPVLGQTPPRPIHLKEFLDLVAQTNLELAATRFNLTIADAQITLARLRPDPQLTAGVAALDLTNQNLPTSSTYGLSQTIELGGKRGARITAAKAGKSLAEAQLEDFFQQLRADATNTFIDALTARQVLERKRHTLESVEKLVLATEQRLRAGDVGQTALWQVKVEAERFHSEVLIADGDGQAANLALGLFLNPKSGETLRFEPIGDLRIPARQFDADTLVADAMDHRSDVLATLRAQDAARAQIDLARANRWIDPFFSSGITESPSDSASGTAAVRSLALGVTVPVPFSRMTHGELDAARAATEQAGVQTAAVKRRVGIQVLQSLARYEATRRAVAVYTSEILSNADQALDATRYSYERGAARLIELLDAQRTVDDVYLAYIGALADHAKALVALQRASARWDVDF